MQDFFSMETKNLASFLGMPILLLAVQILALSLTPSIVDAGYTAFEDPSSVGNLVIFIFILLVFTGLLLLLMAKGGEKIIQIIISFSILLTFWYTFSAIIGSLSENIFVWGGISGLLSIGATVLLYKYPEWYVLDILGVFMCAGIVSIFGISLEIFPLILLLVILAAYDALSVYRTKHMVTLAEGMLKIKAPILVVIPKSRHYSFINDGVTIQQGKEERGAYIMGMGDLIMPTILLISSQVFLTGPSVLFGLTLPTLCALIGTYAGLTLLLIQVNSGNPQAGLPLLNGGAIAGFLIGCALTGTWDWIPAFLPLFGPTGI